ncbi:uncharacterized protein LOC131944143 [Physella acuta]|uniref:uncharacterized protein LOC131944143 n=1 Tax=Physella acuta TaxID=109671 RepID=UPI0027DDDEC1|nr:uncharacterized protein LOC131944143 [Physella acuta]XP_059160642.1 uncharacterized protein LOC131944143 [Physella acuta]
MTSTSPVASAAGSIAMTSPAGWPGSPARQSHDLSFMHRPPNILPNYGKKYKEIVRLKTNLPRVLLYDNVTQQTVLDAQLSGIDTQSMKVRRELELQRKSFLLRKRFKERSLKKLTKVQHYSDCTDFEREYQTTQPGPHQPGPHQPGTHQPGTHQPGTHQPGTHQPGAHQPGAHQPRAHQPGTHQPGAHQPGPRLPDIRYNNKTTRPRGLARGHRASTRKATTSQGESHTGSDDRDFSLPSIAHSNEPGQTEPQSREPGQTEPQSRVGYREQRSAKGLTQIFHTFPNGQSNGRVDPASGQTDSTKNMDESDVISAVVEANKPEAVLEDPGDADRDVTYINIDDESADLVEQLPVNVHQPLLDYRFDQLQRALVKQAPSCEGFLELSPSFVRPHVFQDVSRRFLRLGEPAVLEEEWRGSVYSEGVTPALTQVSGEEEDDVIESRANSAIKRLGAR